MDTTMYYTDSGVLVFGRAGSLPVPPSLLASIVLRLILCPVAILLTWVPLRLLWRNGEFPACVYVLNVWLLILFVFVNAAIWHNQDFDSWWLGYGWCDLQAYVQYALTTAYSASVCAIMQRLSSQVGLTRVASLSAREKRNRLLMQSLIIFPVPLLQVAITVFVQGQRYGIAPGSGCTNEYQPTAVFLVFFILPPLFFTMAACFHTFQTYRKFREVDASSQAALGGTNSIAFSRRQRARRKLYFMVLCILIPYTPIVIAFMAVNIIEGWPWNYPSSFKYVHLDGTVPWNSISILGYNDIGFLALNMSWIPVVSAFIAFIFFGTSKEAINVYRKYLVTCGLGRVFPKLRDVYEPDRGNFDSNASTVGTQLSTLDSSVCQSRKGSFAPAYQSVSVATGESSLRNAVAADGFSNRGSVGGRASSSEKFNIRRWFGKTRASSVPPRGARDLEQQPERQPVEPASPFATGQPVSRTPFNPGFSWFTQPKVPTLPASTVWKPAFSRSRPTRTAEAEPTLPPTSSASTVPMLAPGESPLAGARSLQSQQAGSSRQQSVLHRNGSHRFLPLASASSPSPSSAVFQGRAASSLPDVTPVATTETVAASAPFDGTSNAGSGRRAVSTHVWSDGERQSSSDVSNNGTGTPRNEGTGSDGDGQEQQGVRVDRCITSEVSI